MKYFGQWSTVREVHRDFAGTSFDWNGEPDSKIAGFPAADEIFVATYDIDGYDGSAYVLFRCLGKLYEVVGSHCSCIGLEGQWSPE